MCYILALINVSNVSFTISVFLMDKAGLLHNFCIIYSCLNTLLLIYNNKIFVHKMLIYLTCLFVSKCTVLMSGEAM
jgi:hypothetical protein